jgi:hypothetical protein
LLRQIDGLGRDADPVGDSVEHRSVPWVKVDESHLLAGGSMPSLTRSAFAVLAGYVCTALVVMLGTIAAVGVFGVPEDALPPPGYLLTTLLLGFFAAVGGGWVCATLARWRIRQHATALVLLLVLVNLTLMAVGTQQPAWYMGLLTVAAVAGVFMGALMVERRGDASTVAA